MSEEIRDEQQEQVFEEGQQQEAPRVPLGMPYEGEVLGQEAPFVVWWKMYHKETGAEISMTIRAGDAEMLMARHEYVMKLGEELGYGLTRPQPAHKPPLRPEQQPQPQPAQQVPAPAQRPAPEQQQKVRKASTGDLIAQIELMERKTTKAGKPYLRLKLANGRWASAFDAGQFVDMSQMQEGVQYAPPPEYPYVVVRKNNKGYWNVVTFLRPDEYNL